MPIKIQETCVYVTYLTKYGVQTLTILLTISTNQPLHQPPYLTYSLHPWLYLEWLSHSTTNYFILAEIDIIDSP